MEFMSLSRRRSSQWNVPSGEQRGETDVFAGYNNKNEFLKRKLKVFVYRQTCQTPFRVSESQGKNQI